MACFIACGLVVLLAGAAAAQTSRTSSQQQKVYLKINIEELRLVWNGDRGDAGRGNGEVYLSTWVSWPSNVQQSDPQRKEVGPLGGDVEFLSGTITESPPGSGMFIIEPATVTDKQFGQIYYNEADCPVATEVIVDVLVWDEDSNKNLEDYQKLITAAAQLAGAGVQGAPLAAGVVNALITELTKSSDDALGRATSVRVPIPDPCAEDFGPIGRSVPLKNIAKDLWTSVEALDENGISFAERGIQPPDEIGSLELNVVGGRKVNKFSNSKEKPDDPLAFQELVAIELGQSDEAVVSGALSLGSSLPLTPPPITYGLFLDVDDDPTTGAPRSPARGAEFKLEFAVGPSAGDGVARLLAFDPGSQQFLEQPDGIHDASLDIDRETVFLSASLEALGNPAGPIAGWGTVEGPAGLTDVFPAAPALNAPAVTIDRGPTGVPPFVLATEPLHDAVDVDREIDVCIGFSKSMDRAATESAFTLMPATPGVFAWQGNRLCFQPAAPLAPLTTYDALVDATATDTVGTPLDGGGDLGGPEPFQWRFVTAALPLEASDTSATIQDAFFEGDPLFVAGSGFPSATNADIYVITHDRSALAAGAMLQDMTDDGVTPVVTSADGTLPRTFVGAVPSEGELNVVVDMNGNARFDVGVDRIDATGIGLFVLPRPERCDADADGDTDRNDIAAIVANRNSPAGAGNPLDADGDGRITMGDARICTLECTRDRCEP